jgi:hypothetical protein
VRLAKQAYEDALVVQRAKEAFAVLQERQASMAREAEAARLAEVARQADMARQAHAKAELAAKLARERDHDNDYSPGMR